MIIDAHQHFWMVGRGDYGWLTPESGPLYQDYLPEDLVPLMKKTGVDGTILVQAAPTVAETEFLLSIANENDFVLGVVGWVDFESSTVWDDIDQLADHDKLVGLRPMIHDIPDDDWMLRPGLAPAFEALSTYGLTFDALTFPRHLRNLETLIDRYPEMRVVIDHASKPQIRDEAYAEWAANMRLLAETTTAYCKLSGLVTEAAENWTIDDLRPYTDRLLETFGSERLIWGSDWPVCTLAASYELWHETALELVGGDEEVRAAIFGENAKRAYCL